MSFYSNPKMHQHPWAKASLKAVQHKVYWTDRSDAPTALPALVENSEADLVIIGGGYTGIWTALHAIEENPKRKVILLEAKEVGFGASTRNGGFADVSLVHGIQNGISHYPNDFPRLRTIAQENMKDFLATLKKYNIDASVEDTGVVLMALEDWQMPALIEENEVMGEYGEKSRIINKKEAFAVAQSPLYKGGFYINDGSVMINPAELLWGLKRVVVSLGVQIYENSKVERIKSQKDCLKIYTTQAKVTARKAIIATNAWASPIQSIKKYVVPIHDHVLVTEPLSPAQMQSIGWEGREGLEDSGTQFHYYRLTKDNRILYGGFDAKYYPEHKSNIPEIKESDSYEKMAAHFFHTFPQLEGLKFTHKWSGPIGSTSKFSAAFGTEYGGKLAWAAGYTGLGLVASRFGGRVALDLVDGKDTELTRLQMVRKKPFPFPPHPFRNPIIQFTRKQIAKSDENEGKAGWWLRFLEFLGVGFDS